MRIEDNKGWIGAIATRRNSREQRAQIEEFLCFLLDQGCSVQDSNLYIELARTEEPAQISAERAEGSDKLPVKGVLDDTVLTAVIPHASYQMVSRLITKGADIYARQDLWHSSSIREGGPVTAMHIASIYWNLEGMQALLDHSGERGLIAAIVDGAGRTPLHWALYGDRDKRSIDAQYDQDEITAHMVRAAELLLNANSNIVNIRDNNGASVFHYAAMSHAASESVIPVIKLLFSTKPFPDTINARDSMGNTALHTAIEHHGRGGPIGRYGTPDGQLMDYLKFYWTLG